MAIDGWTSPSSPASLLKGFSLPVAEQEFRCKKVRAFGRSLLQE
jgi:hypothetical protein